MRTFVRVIAFLVVFATGVFFTLAGCGYLLMQIDASVNAFGEATRMVWFPSLALGLALTVSGIVLIAVRPRSRQVGGTTTQDARAASQRTTPSVQAASQCVTPSVQEVFVTIAGGQQQEQVRVPFVVSPGSDGKTLFRKVVAAHWRYLRVGWTEEHVRQLLGGPLSVRLDKVSGGMAASTWDYCSGGILNRTRRGTVTFVEGKVAGFTPPPETFLQWVCHGPNCQA